MLTVLQTLHEIRYKIDYTIIDYKQRYYSSNRNPRIIQTKLKDQRLLSLRTCPHDKYLIKPGEFLSLAPKNDQKENEPGDSTLPYAIDNVISSSDKWSVENEEQRPRTLIPRDTRRVQSMPGSVIILEPERTGPLHCKFCNSTLDCTTVDGEIEKNNDFVEFEDGSRTVKTSPMSKSQRMRHKIMSSIIFQRRKKENRADGDTAPTIEISSAVTESNSKRYHDSTTSESQQPQKSNETDFNESPRVRLISFPQTSDLLPSTAQEPSASPLLRRLSLNVSGTRVHSLVSRISTSSAKSAMSHTECSCAHCERKKNVAWKAIYNDVSLSAARVSTGQSPKTSSDFVNLTSDFIDAKSSGFADENHAHDDRPYTLAPEKHSLPFPHDFSNIVTDSLAHSKPSLLKLTPDHSHTVAAAPAEWSQRPNPASYSRPSTKCEFYSEAGILTMYNYNSDTESQVVGSHRDSRLSTLEH